MAITVGYLVVGIALAYLSSLLLRKKNRPKNLQEDDQPTTLATKGSYIPYPLGKFLIGYAFGWAGDELSYTRNESVGGGGGKGGLFRGPSQNQAIWYSPGWHILCPGIVTALYAIEDNGEEVWRPTVPLTPLSHPSGTVVDAGILGSFEIYWGELDQPVSTYLSSRIGVNSAWPEVCYVVWREARLGPSRAWPSRKYLVEKMYNCVEGLGCPYVLDDGESRGVNPAWVLYAFFSGITPDGAGLPRTRVDRNFLEEFCRLCVSEHLPMNANIEDGQTVDKLIQGMMTDHGFMLDDAEGVLTGHILRPPTSAVPVLDTSVLLAPESEVNTDHDPRNDNQIVFLFKSEQRRYRDDDVSFEQDFGFMPSVIRPAQFSIVSASHPVVATKIASRRVQEVRGDASNLSLEVMRNADLMRPGFPFVITAVGALRVSSVARSTTAAVTTIEAFLDSYSITPEVLGTDDIPTSGTAADPANDLAYTFFELPPELASGLAIGVLRIRAHPSISGSIVWASVDSGEYLGLGEQDYACPGGELLQSMSGTRDDVLATGPTFESYNADITTALDQSSDVAAWQAGTQLLVVDNEVCFLQAVTAVSTPVWVTGHIYSAGDRVLPTSGQGTGLSYVCTVGGTSGATQPSWPRERLQTITDGGVTWQARGFVYRADGIISARHGTTKAAHSVGAIVYIPITSRISPLPSPQFQAGASLCLKSQPFVGARSVPLSGVTPVCKTLTGLALPAMIVTDASTFIITHTGDRLLV